MEFKRKFKKGYSYFRQQHKKAEAELNSLRSLFFYVLFNAVNEIHELRDYL